LACSCNTNTSNSGTVAINRLPVFFYFKIYGHEFEKIFGSAWSGSKRIPVPAPVYEILSGLYFIPSWIVYCCLHFQRIFPVPVRFVRKYR
jgi:hypothetical protein